MQKTYLYREQCKCNEEFKLSKKNDKDISRLQKENDELNFKLRELNSNKLAEDKEKV